MKHKILIAVVAVVCILQGYLAVLYVQSTPQYSLYQVYTSAKKHDYPTFSNYVDVDAVAKNSVNEVLNNAQEEIENRVGKNLWRKFGLGVSSRLMRAFAPPLEDVVKTWIKDEVISGNMMETTFKDVNFFVIFTKMKVTEKDGKAELSATVKGKPLLFKMEKMDGYWRVYDLDLDPELIRSILTQQREWNDDPSASSGDALDKGSGWRY